MARLGVVHEGNRGEAVDNRSHADKAPPGAVTDVHLGEVAHLCPPNTSLSLST